MNFLCKWFCIIICVSLCFSSPCYGGKLDSFEKDATTHRDESDSDSDSFFAEIIGAFFGAVLTGLFTQSDSSEKSDRSYKKEEDVNKDPRTPGEPLLPFFRTDISYQSVESDVDAIDLRAEAGYGPFALHYNQTHFNEKDPDDELDLIRIYGVCRILCNEYVELDPGLGALIIDGNDKNSGFSATIAVIIRPVEYAGFEFRPAWSKVNGTTIQDYDAALLLGRKYISFKLGYRWVLSAEESLNGPYTGISLYF